jgi:hypothetical protein
MSEVYQYVDETVTRRKFEAEWAQFEAIADDYRREGVLLLEKTYPNLYFAFVASYLSPQAIVFAVRINFINFDVWAPSVQFVDALTLQPVLVPQLHTQLVRNLGREGDIQPQQLVQAQRDQIPFICFAGVREYHNHPRHKDDPWLMHRGSGEGRLCFLLDNLARYGTSAIRGYSLQLQIGINGAMHNVGVNVPHIHVYPSMNHLPS